LQNVVTSDSATLSKEVHVVKHIVGAALAASVFLAGTAAVPAPRVAAPNVVIGQGASKIDVTGTWTFQVDTTAGGGTPTFTFKQDGEKLTGHYSGQLGEADLTGSVKGQDINVAFGIEVQGLHLDVTYTGTIESKDAMKGTVKLGDLGQGTFTARRK
jgi:hypothetical protein